MGVGESVYKAKVHGKNGEKRKEINYLVKELFNLFNSQLDPPFPKNHFS
jgi:hypothetical protein